tara:strand:+ start:96 stop:599 length:504 start_codon:yes stop_codon:yes gene_type:complete
MIIQKRKINILLLLSIFLFSLSGCGFAPMYSKKNMEKQLNISISQIDISGERIVDRTIKNNLAYLTKEKDKTKFRIISLNITNKVERKINAKNSKGIATIYNLKLTTVTKILEDNVIVSTRTFEKNFSYNNNENTFELKQYEKIVKTNLATQNSNEIIRFLINYKGS